MSTRDRKRLRRENRKHAARCQACGLVERAEVWRNKARNG